MHPSPNPRVHILGVAIDNLSFDETIEAICAMVRSQRPATAVTPNVDHLMRVRRDPAFREVYAQADLVLPDGVPLLWAARLLGEPFKEKVSGSDLLPRLCEAAAQRGISVFFMGGQRGAAEMCASRLQERYPGLNVVGSFFPPFGFEKDAELNRQAIEAVKSARPDVLFVGVGAPKQEFWIRDNREALQVPFTIGIGASIDFIAGAATRAPRWMQRVGLEWFYRLWQEPRRLWKRYLIQDSPFILLALLEVVRRRVLRRG